MAYYRVPPPYQFRWDFGWGCVIVMIVLGFVQMPAWFVFAAVLTVLRCLVWLCFRFPVTMMFVAGMIRGLRR
jgi:hypothetical protein